MTVIGQFTSSASGLELRRVQDPLATLFRQIRLARNRRFQHRRQFATRCLTIRACTGGRQELPVETPLGVPLSGIAASCPNCRLAMLFGGSIRFSTAVSRSGEYPTSSSYLAYLWRDGRKIEQRTSSRTGDP